MPMRQKTWCADSVKRLRHRYNLTQEKLAEQLGCRQQTVSDWEIGQHLIGNAYCQILTLLEKQLKDATTLQQ